MAEASDRTHLVISIFDDQGNRLSIAWNGIEFNAPKLGRREDPDGKRVDHVGFSTPTNFHSEAINDIVKNGGGLELYNPLVGTRVLNLRGSLSGTAESTIMKQIVDMQRVFHPLYLQSVLGLDEGGALVWPPPAGLPSWVRAHPLTFTRVLPRDEEPTFHPDGLFDLQYHVFPLELPDPARSDVQTGLGAEYEVQFLLADGGRSFDQVERTEIGNQEMGHVWGQAPIWPSIEITMDGAGSNSCTITTTQGHMGTAMILDLSALGAADTVRIDTKTRQIYVNDVADMSIYVSGDYPIFRGNGATTIVWSNTTNITASSNLFRFHESDYI
jgi:hypothetical protein